MADIRISRNHELGLQEAMVAADKMAQKLGEKFDLNGDWSGNRLNFHRPGVTGYLLVSEASVEMEVSLGFMLKMMRGPIENAVHEQLDQVLAKSKPAKAVAKDAGGTVAAKKPAIAAKAKKPAAKKK